MPESPSSAPGQRTARRRYLIDPRRQLRAAFMTTSVVLVLVILVNVGFAVMRSSQSSFLAAVAPQLQPLLDEQSTVSLLAMIGLSLVLVITVSVKTIVETHRTAGAVFAVRQRLERVRQGDYQVSLRLRRNDNLQDLEPVFNSMVAALRDRALTEAETLESLAVRADGMGPEGSLIGNDLRELAARQRELGSDG
jgi:signal transduction histidine kinase